jgi:hypothetical protein
VSDDFDNLLEKLVNNEVDFVIVGDLAGVVYGCTYVTQGIEICCDFSPANLLALQKAISDLDPVHRMTPGRKRLALTEQACSRLKNLYLDTTMGQLDCLSVISGLGDFDQVKHSSELVEVGGIRMRVLNLNALIEAKKAMNRPRDREALLQLEAIKKLKDSK